MHTREAGGIVTTATAGLDPFSSSYLRQKKSACRDLPFVAGSQFSVILTLQTPFHSHHGPTRGSRGRGPHTPPPTGSHRRRRRRLHRHRFVPSPSNEPSPPLATPPSPNKTPPNPLPPQTPPCPRPPPPSPSRSPRPTNPSATASSPSATCSRPPPGDGSPPPPQPSRATSRAGCCMAARRCGWSARARCCWGCRLRLRLQRSSRSSRWRRSSACASWGMR